MSNSEIEKRREEILKKYQQHYLNTSSLPPIAQTTYSDTQQQINKLSDGYNYIVDKYDVLALDLSNLRASLGNANTQINDLQAQTQKEINTLKEDTKKQILNILEQAEGKFEKQMLAEREKNQNKNIEIISVFTAFLALIITNAGVFIKLQNLGQAITFLAGLTACMSIFLIILFSFTRDWWERKVWRKIGVIFLVIFILLGIIAFVSQMENIKFLNQNFLPDCDNQIRTGCVQKSIAPN